MEQNARSGRICHFGTVKKKRVLIQMIAG